MKKIFRIKLGGLQKKTINLVLIVLFLTVAAFFAVSSYQNKMLLEIVGETRIEQQQAISQTSEETMHQVIMNTLVSTTALRANIADNDFAEVVNNTYMLQTMAQGLIGNRDNLTPAEFSLPGLRRDHGHDRGLLRWCSVRKGLTTSHRNISE